MEDHGLETPEESRVLRVRWKQRDERHRHEMISVQRFMTQ